MCSGWRWRGFAIAVTLVAVASVSCGRASDSTSVSAEGGEGEVPAVAPPDSVLRPPAVELPSIPPNEDGELKNENVRDGGMGSLCWARWEIGRNLLRELKGSAEAHLAVAELTAQLPMIEAAVDAAVAEVPGAVRPFAERLLADLPRADAVLAQSLVPAETLRRLGEVFVFDSYPEAAEYVEIASGTCARE